MVLLHRTTEHRDSPRVRLAAQLPCFEHSSPRFPLSQSHSPPASLRPPRSPAAGGLEPLKQQRHGPGERRHRRRRDVEKTSRRHQEDLRFQRSPRNVSTAARPRGGLAPAGRLSHQGLTLHLTPQEARAAPAGASIPDRARGASGDRVRPSGDRVAA